MDESLLQEAHRHYELVPVGPNSKASLTSWNERDFGLDEILFHVRRGGTVGVKMGRTRSAIRIVVIDRDSRTRESWDFIRAHKLQRSTMQVETASGNWHLWFRLDDAVEDLRSKIKILVDGERLPIDVKATGYVLLPPSQ